MTPYVPCTKVTSERSHDDKLTNPAIRVSHAVCRQALPEAVRVRCEDPTSLYNFGWSHGKESLGDRVGPDMHKGSYYANPLLDVPTADVELMRRFPAYCR